MALGYSCCGSLQTYRHADDCPVAGRAKAEEVFKKLSLHRSLDASPGFHLSECEIDIIVNTMHEALHGQRS